MSRFYISVYLLLIFDASIAQFNGEIDFTTQSPLPINIECSYKGAAYDHAYKNHWRLTSVDGNLQFKFEGKRSFVYHVQGSTSNGISYCYINVYVNGNLYEHEKFIDKGWDWKIIPSSNFSTGTNTVKIVLKGSTHLWIDYVFI